jgi:hypothetical protein
LGGSTLGTIRATGIVARRVDGLAYAAESSGAVSTQFGTTSQRKESLMTRFKYSIAAAGGILVLAFVLTAIGPKRVMAALGYTPVREVENPAIKPYGSGIGFTVTSGITTQVNLPAVPAGKRLVIEHVTSTASVPNGQTGFFFIDAVSGGVGVSLVIPTNQQFADTVFPGSDLIVTGQAVRIYADPGTTPSISFRRSSSAGSASFQAFFSGYFVNL